MIYDVIILSVPRIAPVRPQSAPGILKSLCNQTGKTSRVLDINKDFFINFVKTHGQAAKEIDDYFVLFDKILSPETSIVYQTWIDQWVNTVLKHRPTVLCISVFSWQCQRFVSDLLNKIRPVYNGTIIVGGQGLVRSQNMSSHWAPVATYAESLLSAGLIDYYLKGETENTFPKFLAGERNLPGLNNSSPTPLTDANLIPFADYSDLDIESYQNGYLGGVLPIESCRGCVRSCIFCEMSSEHGSYRARQGSLLGQEMIHYYERYKVQHFYFHDDLINGDLQDFDEFLDTILKYYKQKNLPDRYFSISGYWIIRSMRQFDENKFHKFWRAGGNTLVTGVETGSDRLRKKMRKGFTNLDLEFNLEQLTKYKMKFYFMLISGLPGETLEDFDNTLNMLTKWQRFVASGSIIGINLGTTATIEPGTEIYNNYEKYNLVGLKEQRPQSINWMCTETPELDYKERVRRRVILQEHVVKLGYPLWKGDDHLKIIIDKYKENIEVWEG